VKGLTCPLKIYIGKKKLKGKKLKGGQNEKNS
jgi:hypothetical protein